MSRIMPQRCAFACAAALCLISLGACNLFQLFQMQPSPAPLPVLTSLSADTTEITFTSIGSTQSIKVTGHTNVADVVLDLTDPINGTSYRSENDSIASVSANGLVTAMGEGDTKILISNSGIEISIRVTVILEKLVGLTVTPTILDFFVVGQTANLNVVGQFSSGRTADLTTASSGTTYQSDNIGVAFTTPDGAVAAAGAGSTQITVRNATQSATVKVTVNIAPATLTGLSTHPTSLTFFDLADAQILQVQAHYSDGSQRDVTADPDTSLSSVDASVAQLVAKNTVLPVNEGNTQIKVTHKGRGTSVTTTVAPPKPSPPMLVNVAVEPSQINFNDVSQSTAVRLIGTLSDGSTNDLTSDPSTVFVTSNAAVATIDSTGVSRPAGNGSTQLIAGNGGFTSLVMVQVTLPAGAGMLESIEISPALATLRDLAERRPLRVMGRFDNGGVSDVGHAGINFTSSEPTVATVSPEGIVTPLARGSTTVTASHNGLMANAIITVDICKPATPLLGGFPTMVNIPSVHLTGTAEDGATIEAVSPAGMMSTVAAGGAFALDLPLTANRANSIFVTAVSTCGARGSPATANVTCDVESPALFIDFPPDGSVLDQTTVDIAGRTGDLLSGFMGLSVTVNGVAATVNVGIGNNGTFLASGVPLLTGAPTTVTAVATDAAGNITQRSITLTQADFPADALRMFRVSGDGQSAMMMHYVADPLVVRVENPDGSPFANKIVTFEAIRSDGRLSTDGIAPGVMKFQTHTDAIGEARAFWQLGSDAGNGNNRIKVTSMDVADTLFFCASATAAPPKQINVGLGNMQRAEVGAPLPDPLIAWVSDGCNPVAGIPVTFTVTRGGGTIDGQNQATIITGATGHASIRLMLGPDEGENEVEANYPGNPSMPAVFMATGVVRIPGAPTQFKGVIINNAGVPLGGAPVTLFIGGQVTPPVLADVKGQFCIDNIPGSGPADLFIAAHLSDTAGGQPIPTNLYPDMGYHVMITPNAVNTLPMPVLLPRLEPGNWKNYSTTNETELTVAGLEGLRMIVAPGSMKLPSGQPAPNGMLIGLNQVHHDLIPMPMPDGAAPPFAWTLQPAGSSFDPPIRIEYPNMSGLPAGGVANFLSFDHATNKFQIVCSGTVSPDGSTIVSDPGTGLTIAGWGGNCPPYAVTGTVANCISITATRGSGAPFPEGSVLHHNDNETLTLHANYDPAASEECGDGPPVWSVTPSQAGMFVGGNMGDTVTFQQSPGFLSSSFNDVKFKVELTMSSAELRSTVIHVNSTSGILAAGATQDFPSEFTPAPNTPADVIKTAAAMNDFIAVEGYQTREFMTGVDPLTQPIVTGVINRVLFKAFGTQLRIEVEAGSAQGDVFITFESGGLLLHQEHMTVIGVTVEDVWSNQFPGVKANVVPNRTGRPNFPYALLAHRADDMAHVQAHVKIDPDTPQNRNLTLVRLCQAPAATGTSGLVPVGTGDPLTDDGASLLATIRAPDTRDTFADEAFLYMVAAGIDSNTNGSLESAEIGSVQGGGTTHLKIVNRAEYDDNYNFLGNLATGGLVAAPAAGTYMFYFLGEGLNAFSGAIAQNFVGVPSVYPATMDINRLDHNVGVPWPNGDPPAPAPVDLLRFDQNSGLADTVLNSPGFEAKLSQTLNSHNNEVINFVPSPGSLTHMFTWPLGTPTSGGGLDRLLDLTANCSPPWELGGCGLFASFGSATAYVTLNVLVDLNTLHVLSIDVDGTLVDFYDWNASGGFSQDRRAATVQAGFGTLGGAGKVFRSEVRLVRTISPTPYVFTP